MHEARDVVPLVGDRVMPAWSPTPVRPGDGNDVAVLLLDTLHGLVTYANPAALSLTGSRSRLPEEASAWTAAARLVLPRGSGDQAVPVVDPVAVVAAGGTVPGMRLEVRDDQGRLRPYWITGSQLLSASGVAGGRAIVALFPVAVRDADGHRSGPEGSLDGATAGLPLAGADGAAITRADPAARSAVAEEALREGRSAAAGATGTLALAAPAELGSDVDELTARALLASSISFTISDPRRPDDPLVWVNPAFERMTGYAAQEMVGRNCRVLQGPGTDRAAVARVRDALQRREGVRAELLNYRKDGSPFWNSFTISPVLDGEGRLTHFVGVQTDVTARVIAGIEYERLLAAEREAREVAERARGRLDVIVEVGAVLTETLDATDAMRRLADALVPAAADYCVIDLMEQPVGLPVMTDGSGSGTPPPEALRVANDLLRTSRRVAAAHPDDEVAAALAATRILPGGGTGSVLPAVALTGVEPVVRNDLTETEWAEWAQGDPDTLAVVERVQTSAAVIAPMRARGRVIGALTLGHTRASGRRFDDQDVDLARTVAARAALAVDNALLLEAETEQRRRADSLAAAGAALAASGLRSTDAVEVLLDRVVPTLGDRAFVHLDEHASLALRPPEAGPGLQLVATRDEAAGAGEAPPARPTWAPAAGAPGPGVTWSTGRPSVVSVDAGLLDDGALGGDDRLAFERLLGGALVSVPLTVRGTTFGVLTVARTQGPRYAGDEVRFVAELGHRLALALDNARLYESERQVALELQRSLLPDRLPRVAELDVAGRYLAGAAGAEVGGDWYDVIPLSGRRVAVAVGDVMGRGVRAAAVMGQLRAALRSYAVEGLPPARMLEHLGAFTEVLEGEHLVTCLVGVHDAVEGTITLASAGHPPPLRLGTNGVAAYADVAPGLPLGVPTALVEGSAAGYEECTVAFEPGATLLMFTDGLVEDRDTPVGAGLERLAEGFAGQVPPDAESACEAALRVMGRDASHDDDTAVLAMRATPLSAPDLEDTDGTRSSHSPSRDDGRVRVDLQSTPQAARFSRAVVTDVLLGGGLPELVDTASLLVSELVTNALRHGGGPRELLVKVDAQGVGVAVRDDSPRPPYPAVPDGPGATLVVDGGLAENGRGLLLVDLLADSWGWRPENGGKLVWFRLARG